jgi:hypothetical protein
MEMCSNVIGLHFSFKPIKELVFTILWEFLAIRISSSIQVAFGFKGVFVLAILFFRNPLVAFGPKPIYHGEFDLHPETPLKESRVSVPQI